MAERATIAHLQEHMHRPDPDQLQRITPRLTVRLTRPADREAWIAAHQASGAHFARWMPRPDPATTLDQHFDAQLARTLDGVRNDTAYVFVAEHRGDRDLLAFISISQVFRGAFLNGFAGWRVTAPRTRQGFGVEALSAVLDIAFAPTPSGLGLHRVQANVIPSNEPSLRLARRVGFREEGYALKYLEIDGTWQDHVMFAKLAEEHAAQTCHPEGA